MCGICGFVDTTADVETGRKMLGALAHRGPDSQDVKQYAMNHCVMCHARLSVIDLSEAAGQPMEYGHLSIVFNGEIYNFKEIRKELEAQGHRFLLQSDTEIILHAYDEWGISCVDRFIGMFAFVILDRQKNELILVRDRAGVKPLYYYQDGNTFLFASELKAFYHYPSFRKNIQHEAVGMYFRYGYIPAPYCIFEHTYKLEAGCYMKYDIIRHSHTIGRYWDLMSFYHAPLLQLSYEEAKEELERLLVSAFNYRMVADVPVGVFLSAGFDSTGVAALLQKERTDRLKTFTIGFPVGNDESQAAREIARYLGTDHTEYICTQEDCKKIIPDMPYYFDEPFADNSAVPTILVSRLARQNVTVALSADGGDETFVGYNSYDSFSRAMRIVRLTSKVRGKGWKHAFSLLSRPLPAFSFLRTKGESLAELMEVDSCHRPAAVFESGESLAKSVYGRFLKLDYPNDLFTVDSRSFHDEMSVATAIDYRNYMANDILVKVDRATMSCSLEGREPLLDHRLIEFAARLPLSYKYGDGVKKKIYRDIVYQYIPKDLLDRPKTGFTMPIAHWLRTDLKYLVADNLNDSMDSSLFRIDEVKKLRLLFENDKLRHEDRIIWRMIAFQLWYKKNVS